MKYTFEAPVTLSSYSTAQPVDGSQTASNRINTYLHSDDGSELSQWLHGDAGLDKVVTSIQPSTRYNGADVISVTVCETTQDLSQDQIDVLADYISGQFSDGWGEGFEQQMIPLGRGGFCASFWSSSHGWDIKLV